MRDNLLVRPQRVGLMNNTGAILVVAGVGVVVGLPVAVAVAMLAVTNVSGLWRPLWPRGYPPYYFPPSDHRLRLRRVAFAATGATVTGLVLSAPLFGLTLGLVTGGVAVALPIRLERRRVSGICSLNHSNRFRITVLIDLGGQLNAHPFEQFRRLWENEVA